jgi:hypothetical protein
MNGIDAAWSFASGLLSWGMTLDKPAANCTHTQSHPLSNLSIVQPLLVQRYHPFVLALPFSPSSLLESFFLALRGGRKCNDSFLLSFFSHGRCLFYWTDLVLTVSKQGFKRFCQMLRHVPAIHNLSRLGSAFPNGSSCKWKMKFAAAAAFTFRNDEL